jgi:hypothetical protein
MTEYSSRPGRLPTSRSSTAKEPKCHDEAKNKRKTQTSAAAACVAGFCQYPSGHPARPLASLTMLIIALLRLLLATMVCPPGDPRFSSLCSFQVCLQSCHFRRQDLKPNKEQLEDVKHSAEFIMKALREA